MADEALEKALQPFAGVEVGTVVGPDLVNEPMIRHWCEVMGDRNPVYTDAGAAACSAHGGLVAPPTMLQAWVLSGPAMARDRDAPGADKQRQLHAILDRHGYTGVVATNCEQEYRRYLAPGDQVKATTVIESISEQKATGLGTGYFINTRITFFDGDDEEVGAMTFRVLKFKPAQDRQAAGGEEAAPQKPGRIRPPRGHDNGWWWEAIERGELMIQKCVGCSALRHPPRPMCPECQSERWEPSPSAGSGSLHSYVIMHHPPIPGYGFPLPVALVDLDEGVRLVANIDGCEHAEIEIGMRVQCSIEEVEEGFALPVFRPAR